MKIMRKGRKCHKCGYEKNAPEAAWCGLCYEPFSRPQEAARQPAPVPPPTAPEAGQRVRLLFFIIPALLGAALALFQFQHMRGGAAAAAGPSPFAGKTAEADRLLQKHRQDQAAFLAELESGDLDPDGFGAEGQYTRRLFRLEDGYANTLNALQLPCPGCEKAAGDAAYQAWIREHQAREAAAMNEFNSRYAALALKAAAAQKP